MKLDVTGKTVLVTGASQGIGRGLAACFARDGANLFLTDLPSQKVQLEQYASELAEKTASVLGPSASTLPSTRGQRFFFMRWKSPREILTFW